jgi:hypothetical protein
VPSCRKGTGWSENPRPRSCGARVLVSISISIASASPTPIGVREASVEGRRREKRFSASSTDICRGVMVPIEVSCAILVVATAQTSQRTREEVHGGLAEDPHFRRGRTKGTCGVGSRIGDAHGPHRWPHKEHVCDVHASGVETTTKCLVNSLLSPRPRHGGCPLLPTVPACPATPPHAPYAINVGASSRDIPRMRRTKSVRLL